MEISQIIENTLGNNKNIKPNIEVEKLLQELYNHEIDYICNVNNKENNKLDYIISKVYDSSNENQNIELTSIFLAGVYYFKKAMKNKEIKSLLIFFTITSNLDIKLKGILDYKKDNRKKCSYLLKEASSFIQNYNIKFALNYSEIKSIINKGFKNNSIMSVYTYIQSMKNGLIYYNFLANEILSFIKEIDFNYFIETFLSIKTTDKAILFLSTLNENQLLKLVNVEELKNKWLNFELLRQFIIRTDEKTSKNEKYYALIKKLIKKIYNEDYMFFKQTIEYHLFNYNETFNISLGYFLADCSNNDLSNIIKNCFKINKYPNTLNPKNKLLQAFENNVNVEKYNFLLKLIFNKWCEFLKELISSDDFCKELILTDYANFIIQYYDFCSDDENIIKQLKTLFLQIKYINSEWFLNFSNLITQFYIYLTQIFLISYIYKDRKIKNNEITNLFLEFKENKIINQRFYLNDNTLNLNILEKNLS